MIGEYLIHAFWALTGVAAGFGLLCLVMLRLGFLELRK